VFLITNVPKGGAESLEDAIDAHPQFGQFDVQTKKLLKSKFLRYGFVMIDSFSHKA